MNKKTYTVKDLETELFTNFPELKNIVTFVDPKDYNNMRDVEETLLPLFEADAEHIINNKPMLPNSAKQGLASQRMAMTVGMIKAGLPFAQNLRIDEDIDSLAGKDCIIFGGKADLSAKDVIWRVMAAASSNMLASMDEKFQNELQNEMEKHYQMPTELNDSNMLQTLFLDHEIGHAITMPMMKQSKVLTGDLKHHMECIADAYSMIRHYQRYGSDSPMGEYLSSIRSAAAVMVPDTIHWTSEALNEVMDLNKQGKLQNLSQREAIDLAVKISDKTGFGLDEGNNIKKAFDTSPLIDAFVASAGKAINDNLSEKNNTSKPANDGLNFGEGLKKNIITNTLDRIKNKDKTIERIGNIALTTKSSAVYRVAKEFLSSIDKLWPNVDKDKLQEIRQNVKNRGNIPTTEPKKSWFQRKMHEMQTQNIRKKFGR